MSDSYNPEQPQFDRAPVWMRLGNGRPPHPIPRPPQGVFHPAMGMRSRELLPVTPNPPRLTVQGNEIAMEPIIVNILFFVLFQFASHLLRVVIVSNIILAKNHCRIFEDL